MGTVNVSTKYTVKEKVYLIAIAQGMLLTLRRFFMGLILRKKYTIMYPEQKRDYSQRFRGEHFITVDQNKTENCTACFLCETVCPAECIHIVAEERDPEENIYGVRKEKKPLSFDIDALRCCFCGFCEEACPKDAIKLSRNYEMSVLDRSDAIYDLDHLKRNVKGRG
jgi:NADH-quinone oxidoreductase subunit I